MKVEAGQPVTGQQAFDALAAEFAVQVAQFLNTDPACAGRVSSAACATLGGMAALGALSPVDAISLGRARERREVMAFLAGRRRMALTIAARNPDQAERARDFAQQIEVELDAIGQGLHEGASLMAETVAA